MTIEQLTTLFQWMSIINVAIFIVSCVMIMLMQGVATRIHSKLFGLEASQAAVVNYAFLGGYKLLILVFNLVPYVALLVIQSPK